MIIWEDLSASDAALLGKVLAEESDPPVAEEVHEAIADLRLRKYKRDLRRLTERIRTAEKKRDVTQAKLLLIMRRVLEGNYLMDSYAGDFSAEGEKQWWHGSKLLDEAHAAARKLQE